MGSGRCFALALHPQKEAPSHGRRWFRAQSVATKRLQEACDPALEPSRAALPGVRDSTVPARAGQPTATSLLWPGRHCPSLCDVHVLRINRYRIRIAIGASRSISISHLKVSDSTDCPGGTVCACVRDRGDASTRTPSARCRADSGSAAAGVDPREGKGGGVSPALSLRLSPPLSLSDPNPWSHLPDTLGSRNGP